MRDLSLILGIGFCGALGAIARYGVGVATHDLIGEPSPLGTLIVNVLGCFLLGMLALSSVGAALPAELRLALAVGFLGGLTTFSAFGVETFDLMQRGQTTAALTNIGAQLLLGIVAAWAGASFGGFVSSLVGGPS